MRLLAPLAVVTAVLATAAPGSGASSTLDAATGDVAVLVTLDERVPDVAAAARAVTPAGGRVGRTWSSVLKGYGATVPAAALPALSRAPGVVRVEADPRLTASSVQPSAPDGLDRIDQRARPLDGTYSFTRTGTGVTAYVVDTGIRRSHSDFGGRARTGFDAVTPGGTADDCDGHGTHVAGTVGGTRFGVAKAVALSAVRVLGCDGSGSGSALLAGLDFVVRDHDPGERAVAVLSLGGAANETVDAAVAALVADGVSVSVAAGNEDADSCLTSPARVPEVLTVGASDPGTDARAFFSNRGACLDVYAPGVDIPSAGIQSDTSVLLSSGTSMAAPHVAGAAASLLETDPGATPAQVAEAVRTAATEDVIADPQSPVDDLLFTGSVAAALLAPPPSPAASPSSSPAASTGSLLPDAPQGVEDVRGRFTPLRPSRVLDTRNGTGGTSGRFPARTPVELQVSGRGGVPPTGVTAVALNVTVTGPLAQGHLTVYPAGGSPPLASNLNHAPGQTVANLVASGLSSDGRVALVSSSGTPHVVADVVGYWSDTLGGSRSQALTPTRLLDTRSGVGAPARRLADGAPLSLRVAGRGGVPASGASAVVLNVTAVDPLGAGFLTVYAGGTTPPQASNLNFGRGTTVPNLVLAQVGGDGTVQVRTPSGSPHVLADVVGWYGADAPDRFVSVAPQRLLDTRKSGGRLAPGQAFDLAVGGRGSLPGLGVTAVVVNVTAVGAVGSGHLTVYPADRSLPNASNVNYRAGQTVPNLVLSGATVESGEITIRSSGGSPHVVVDVVGYTTATSTG